MQKLAKRISGIDDDLLKGILVRGLQPQIKAFVLQQQAPVKSIGNILEVARVVETAGMLNTAATQNDMASVMEEIRASRVEIRQLSSRVDRMTVSAVGGAAPGRSPTPEARRVTFASTTPEERRSPARYDARGQGGRSFRGASSHPPSRIPAQQSTSSCYRCGRSHLGPCPAINVNCYTCGRRGHLSARCRGARRGMRRPSQ